MANIVEQYVKFQRGTPTAYKNYPFKDSDTFYFVAEADSDIGQLYLGEQLVSASLTTDAAIAYLSELKDVNTTGAENGNVLCFDAGTEKWIPVDLEVAIKIPNMIGATASSDGVAGLVPPAAAGQQDYFLKGDGTWAPINASESGRPQIFVGEPNGKSHAQTITELTKNAVLHSGDIVIIREPIKTGKYSYTAYVYTGKNWTAMNGNYKADNVYFTDNLITTVDIGEIETDGKPIELATAGKNLKQVFNELFYIEKEPVIIQPEIEHTEFTFEDGAVEVGTTVNIGYDAILNPGFYSFGPETGVLVSAWTISDTNGNIITLKNSNSINGSLSSFVVKDDTDYHITLTANYGDGVIPLTNIGNEFPQGQIRAGSKTFETGHIFGYRPFFYGVDNSTDEITSEVIRNLTNGGRYDEFMKLEIKTNQIDNPIRIIIAYPKNSERKGLVSATLDSTMGMDILSEYSFIEVNVADAAGQNPVPYIVRVYQPYVINADEIHTLILE